VKTPIYVCDTIKHEGILRIDWLCAETGASSNEIQSSTGQFSLRKIILELEQYFKDKLSLPKHSNYD
jgi:hypothetical protein